MEGWWKLVLVGGDHVLEAGAGSSILLAVISGKSYVSEMLCIYLSEMLRTCRNILLIYLNIYVLLFVNVYLVIVKYYVYI